MVPTTLNIAALLLDIEGTTTPIDFVYKVLFPFARDHVADFLAVHSSDDDVQDAIKALVSEHDGDVSRGLNPPVLDSRSIDLSLASIVRYFHWLMDQDRKSTPLKSLQGRIWEEGYRIGELHSLVFEDVPAAFASWHTSGKRIYIYSSGSVLAQKLLFANTEAGDLTRFIEGYFDTNIGRKMERQSYERIAAAIGLDPSRVVFVSDVTAELDAAIGADMRAILCIRPGNRPQQNTERYPTAGSLSDLTLDA